MNPPPPPALNPSSALNPTSSPNPNPNPPATFSPTSLLWAHQLRREHNVLVSRLDALERTLTSTSAKLTTRTDALKDELGTRLTGLEGLVAVVQGGLDGARVDVKGIIRDVEEVRGDVEGLEGWKGAVEGRERERDEREKVGEEGRRIDVEEREKGREMIEGVEKGLREVMAEIKELKGIVEELRRERDGKPEPRQGKGKEERAPHIPCSYPNLTTNFRDDTQQHRSSSLPPISSYHRYIHQHRQHQPMPSTISGTPTASHLPTSALTRSSPPPQSHQPQTQPEYSAVLVPDSIPPAPPTSPTEPHLSLITHPSEKLEMEYEYPMSAGARERTGAGTIIPTLRQRPSESLHSYLERGEAVLARFPRQEENRVVLAFWGGVRDGEFRGMLEEGLKTGGWRWEVVRGLILEKTGRGVWEERDRVCGISNNGVDSCGDIAVPRVGVRVVKKRKMKVKRRRRVIPVIWPVEEEGEVGEVGEEGEEGEEGGWFVIRNGLT
ncbi:hypothetical protein PAAG_00690 [Paracoccidioides lutzii Pb01]|uniref:Uncharacterized protein n=1 Tax=Paracoccidioides lutzii (strain ATCC MYA-826 / Pb01) TaxID=502779 RepID=C1GQ95_PARBA|nr:hypothetical protein PAAG_00690 [Paracoccidioides lutzii Pb01]EEH37769.2 hypothetical protein PAAG_00690 [Paracoccidioides lutzii Pb01]